VIAGIIFLFGVRSLVRWMGAGLETASVAEHLLFTAHVTSRVGLWFAFAGFFVGYALIDDVGWVRWYVFVVLGLAAVQLMTSVFLARSPGWGRFEEGGHGRD
jgi:hypothetical protein